MRSLLRPHALLTLLTALALTACGEPSDNNDASNNGADNNAVDMASNNDASDMPSGEDMPGGEPDMDTTDMGSPSEEDMASGEEDMASALVELPPRPWTITEDGPYNIAYRTETISYKVRPTMEDRELELVYWYPTLQTEGKRARYLGLLARSNVLVDVEPADVEAPYPLLVFSHGNGSLAEQNYFQTERFASHGWIVVAPYHTNNTLRDNPSAINLRSSLDRPQDISAILDHLENLPADHPLANLIDMDKIALSGHSFGAFTTLSVAGAGFAVDEILSECDQGSIDPEYCELFDEEAVGLFREGFEDDRVKVAIPMAPGIGTVFREGVADIDIPTLLMTARRDQALPEPENAAPIWEGMVGPHARFDLPNGGHFTFSNMCELVGSFVEMAAEDGCDDTFIPAEVALPMINHYALGFAQYHLLGDMRFKGLVEGTEQPYPAEDLVYTTK